MCFVEQEDTLANIATSTSSLNVLPCFVTMQSNMSIARQIENHQYFRQAQDVTKKEIKDAYPVMLDYTYVNC